MMSHPRYATFRTSQAGYLLVVLVCVLMVGLGAYCALTMEHFGHAITGMNNHVVWGLPHVFAVGLIVSASGALNGATLASVFDLAHYKPIARLSVAVAMSFLIGGLLVLVLDLGRPDRLIVAMTTYNFRSIFTWNIFLYTGFLAIGAWYLWMMMEKRFNRHIKNVGRLAFAWRVILTSGTGSIFGFLVGRNALDSALLAPLFVALSLVMGTAVLALVVVMLNRWRNSLLTDELVTSLSKMLVWFLLAVVYFSVVHHLTNLYVSEHRHVEQFTLTGSLSGIFWVGHVIIGVVAPAGLLVHQGRQLNKLRRLVISAFLSILGGFGLLYVIIIGSQSTPQVLFPDKIVLASRFGDAGFPTYHASTWEWGLGLGGVSLAVLLCLLLLSVLPLLPTSDNTEFASS